MSETPQEILDRAAPIWDKHVVSFLRVLATLRSMIADQDAAIEEAVDEQTRSIRAVREGPSLRGAGAICPGPGGEVMVPEVFNSGDWVRFFRDGQLVIGKVEYVSEDTVQSWRLYLNTDQGRVEASSVLEIRRSPEVKP